MIFHHRIYLGLMIFHHRIYLHFKKNSATAYYIFNTYISCLMRHFEKRIYVGNRNDRIYIDFLKKIPPPLGVYNLRDRPNGSCCYS